MKIIGMIGAALVLLVVGGFIYLAVADVAIEQTTVTKNIEPAAGK